jgi:hypothetical protein
MAQKLNLLQTDLLSLTKKLAILEQLAQIKKLDA